MSLRSDDGSISIEYVILTPMIFLVLALIYLFARVSSVNSDLDSATRDAARVASRASDRPSALTAASGILATQFAGFTCLNNTTAPHPPTVLINGTFAPGQTITVLATCQYDLSDLGIPGAPGSITVTSQFSSMIDPNRT